MSSDGPMFQELPSTSCFQGLRGSRPATASVATSVGYDIDRRRASAEPERFWAEQAKNLVSWSEPWQHVLSRGHGMNENRWFTGGMLNVAYNCLDRHIDGGRKNTAAIIWQGDGDDEVRVYTYQMLHAEVSRFANVLRNHGVEKGDRVVVYLPMIPELAVAMLACARIGAVHSVVFIGFSAVSLRQRIEDSGARLVVTADTMLRGGRVLPLKRQVDEALLHCSIVTSCIVVQRTSGNIAMQEGRDYWYHREMKSSEVGSRCEPVAMAAEDPLFIMYTSGSTGRPKGVVHSCGGYFVYALTSCRYVFDIQDDDICWCTADIGWITGHTYTVYGPLGLGGTTLMFEGIPSHPGPDRLWQVAEKYAVSLFYTAPTVIRALMRYGNEPADIHDLSSLRLLGSVGEPLSQDAWRWYHEVIGHGRLPVIDTWWQTETGGIMLSSSVGGRRTQPSSSARPLPGVEVMVLDDEGNEVSPGQNGNLVISRPWPGMSTGVFGDGHQYQESYFSKYPGMYCTGDIARREADGGFSITGRLDDVINVSGHRVCTAEVESALVAHPSVAEAAVVAMPHEVLGQAIYAYITVKENVGRTRELLAELQNQVRSQVGPIAAPEVIQYARGLPKTRSGKIMRRVLRKIAAEEFDDFGDTSALADPSVIRELIEGKKFQG